ncbi:unnamed protein product, partial [Cyprideis torosa]
MPIDWQVKLLSKVNSTQDIVMLAAQDGDPEGYVVQAMTMNQGRGRQGKSWDAPMGNVYLSALLRPTCGIERAGELAFVVAVALSEALDNYLDHDKHVKTLKWPNDILIDGLKVSGILLESNMSDGVLDGLVVGIGVNVFNAPDLATCLNKIAKEPVYVNKIRDVILEKLDEAYTLWQKEGFEPIRQKWLEQAHGLNQPITARLPKASYQGIFSGLTKEGSLVLTQEDGTEKIIHAGEIDTPEQMGADRLVGASAAVAFYQSPAIIVDFGTATTFDIIDGKGIHRGGVIAPGVNLSLRALEQAAAQLPDIKIEKPEKVIGFADEYYPGVDILLPDPTFLEDHAQDLAGMIITHAHEDHIGAVAHLWP